VAREREEYGINKMPGNNMKDRKQKKKKVKGKVEYVRIVRIKITYTLLYVSFK
jgi:hypothetical protein